MTEQHQQAKAAIEAEERAIAGLPLDSKTLMAIATKIINDAPAPVAVKIVVGRRIVALMAADGLGVDNERFLDLKINTVFNTGHSSLWWFHHLRSTGRTLVDVKWANPAEVIDMGGGVPLFSNGQVVGAVAVSGLAHDADHSLIMASARSSLG